MRWIGIDPSSSLSAYALVDVNATWDVVDGDKFYESRILTHGIWKKNDKASDPENLSQYKDWLVGELTLGDGRPIADFACIEFLSITRNAQTTRKVSHYQAASVLACKEARMMVIEARVSSARATAIGKSGSKDEAWEAIKKMFPDYQFPRKTSGGTDVTDSVVLALAGRNLAER